MNDKLWVIEIDQGGINWTPIAYSGSEAQALKLAAAPHIVSFGKPVRVRETRALILIALLLSGCGESVSERSANEKCDLDIKANEARDYKIDDANRYADGQLGSAEQRLRSLEERVTALEGK